MASANIFLLFVVLISVAAVFGQNSCGSKVIGSGLIIGGKFSMKNEWPWLAALLTRSDSSFFCGGTLISSLHVITAAHCIQPKGQRLPKSFDEIVVYMGKHNLSVSNEHGSKSADPVKVLLHKDWNYITRKYDADIAIIFFEGHVVFTDKIKPACLPDAARSHQKGTVAGWVT